MCGKKLHTKIDIRNEMSDLICGRITAGEKYNLTHDNIPFLYNGQYGVTTDSNGLYYMRASFYNVEIKRFINQDVLHGVLERVSTEIKLSDNNNNKTTTCCSDIMYYIR